MAVAILAVLSLYADTMYAFGAVAEQKTPMASGQVSKDNKGIRASRVFRFVFSEMVRLQTELNERRISHWHMTDALSWIRMPSGRNRTIGRLANQKLYELAKKTIEKNDKLNGRIAPRYLVEEFKLELAKELALVDKG